MEFEGVNEEVKWKCRRVAAAFGVKSFGQDLVHTMLECKGSVGDSNLHWFVGIRDGTLHLLHIYHWNDKTERSHSCSVHLNDYWGTLDTPVDSSSTMPMLNKLMARGLYCLGYEDDERFDELNHPLSAHEKMELRFSFPHEFWPKMWLDEEGP